MFNAFSKKRPRDNDKINNSDEHHPPLKQAKAESPDIFLEPAPVVNDELNITAPQSDIANASNPELTLNLSETSDLFATKARYQWEEAQQLIEEEVTTHEELNINQPATNMDEFNELEELLDEINLNTIRSEIDDNRSEIERNNELNLSDCALTRFDLKKILEDEKYNTLILGLNKLDLSHNMLRGSIPLELEQLINLKFLFMDENQLNGPIPLALADLINLEHLSLSGNQLSGHIPPEIGLLLNLEYLNLSDNNLSGLIPSELALLKKLECLSLNGNGLEGAIPHELGQLVNLEELALSNNKLTGSVPVELKLIAKLLSLELNNNMLSGYIPSELTQRFPNISESGGRIANQDVPYFNRPRP